MRRALAIALALPYLLIVLYLTLILAPNPVAPTRHYWNLTPLRTITAFFHKGGIEMIINNVGNLVVLMPFGFLLPLAWGRCSAWHAALFGLVLSSSIECAQFFTRRRVADIDDVLLNTLGAVLGYAAYVVIERGLRLALPAVARR